MDTFEEYRGLLFAIAYRMTGSVMEAEDLVQETYLRYSTSDLAAIRSHRAFLTTIVTRLAINRLESSRYKREQYIGPWLPEPVLTADHPFLVQSANEDTPDDSISAAFLLLLERLTPPERAVFLLYEVFDYRYDEIAQILERTEVSCRKLGTRAKQALRRDTPRFTVTIADYEAVIDRFLTACQTGDVQGLMNLLAQEATMYSDGGGKATAGTKPISGSEIVAHFIIGGLRVIADQAYTWEVVELNGRPAIVVRIQQTPFGVVQFDLTDTTHIGEVHFITNPDKIRHL